MGLERKPVQKRNHVKENNMNIIKLSRISLEGAVYIIEYTLTGMSGTYKMRRGEFGSYTTLMNSDDMHATLRTLGFTRGMNTTMVMDMAVESLFSRGSIKLTRAMVSTIVKGLGENKINTLIYSRVKKTGDSWVIPAKIAKDPDVYNYLSDLMSHQKMNN